MRRLPHWRLVLVAVVMLPFLMGAACTSRDIEKAFVTGGLNYLSGSTRDGLNSFVPLSRIYANFFAGPTGEQDL
jgi:hypothetical protein